MEKCCLCPFVGLCQLNVTLLEACQNLDWKAVERLINNGHNANQMILEWGASFNRGNCLHVCLASSSSQNYQKDHKCRQKCLGILLRHGADPNQRNDRGWTPIMMAAVNDDTDSIDMLLKAGGGLKEISYYGENAFSLAISHSNFTAASTLFRAGADINAKGLFFPGHVISAAKLGDLKQLKFLIQIGCDLNQTCNKRGATALHHAILSGRMSLRVLQLLVDAGADINVMDNAGSRPIHWAMFLKDKCVVKFLLAHNADINSHSIRNQRILDAIYSVGLTSFLVQCGYGMAFSKSRGILFYSMPSLKSLCRKTIRSRLGLCPDAKIASLPLPNYHKAFLEMNYLQRPEEPETI